MADYQALVENIRGFLGSSFQLNSPDVAEWAEQYARLCRGANDRLRQCADCMNRGLRAEAIHIAEAAPNLLDLVAALDLPELPEWEAVCFRFELVEPPSLLLETAASLNEAYAQDLPAQGLMAYHRLLALARAPMKSRLLVMRRLADLEPANNLWDQDIRGFERVRLQEIRTALPALAKAGDGAALSLINTELGSGWRLKVPAELSQGVARLQGQVHRQATEAELRRRLPALNEAYSATSFRDCWTLLSEFTAVAAEARVPVPPDLQEQVDPIANWVAEQQERAQQATDFQEACDSLQQGLDTDLPTLRLEQRYRAAHGFHTDLPAPLEQRYQGRLRQRIAALRHKRLMIFSGIAAAFLLCAGLVGAVIYKSNRASEVRDADGVIRQAVLDVAAGNGERAQGVVKQVMDQHPRLASNPVIIQSLSDFRAVVAAEQERVAGYDKSLETATRAGEQTPDEAALQQAESLARSPAEQEAVAAIRARIAEFRSSRQERRDSDFVAAGSALAAEIQRGLPAELAQSDPSAFEKRMGDFAGRVEELRGHTGVTESLKGVQVQSLTAILKQGRGTLDGADAQRQASDVEQRLLAHAREPMPAAEHAVALQAYLDKFPSAACAADFRRALQQVDAEKAVEGWIRVSAGWDGHLLPPTYRAATDRKAAIEKYLADYPASPVARELSEYLTYVKAGLAAAVPEGPWKKSYHDLLLNPLIRDLKVLETTSGKRYYVLGDPGIKDSTAQDEVVAQSFLAITSSDVGKKKRIDLKRPDLLKSKVAAPSPQSDYARQALARLDAIDYADWELTGAREICDLTARGKMDTVLRAILIQSLLQLDKPMLTWAADDVTNDVCSRVYAGLTGQNTDDVEWLDPDNPPRQELVNSLDRLIAQLPPLATFQASIRKRRDAVLAAVPTRLATGGVLVKDKAGLRLGGQDAAPAGSAAFAVVSGALVQVARRDGKAWAFDSVRAQQVPDGSLLFVLAPAAK